MRPLVAAASLFLIVSLFVPQVSAASNASCSDGGSGTGLIALSCSDSYRCNGTPDPGYPNCYYRLSLSVSSSPATFVVAQATTPQGTVSCNDLGGCSASEVYVVLESSTSNTMSCTATVVGSGSASVSCSMVWGAWTSDVA